MSTTTDLTTLKINYLTQSQYDTAKSGGTINENEIYMTPTGSLIDLFYPVGSYYETSDTTFNPNTAWGGTWYLEVEGQVHVSGSGNSEDYPVGTLYTNVVNANNTVGQTQGGSLYIQEHSHNFTDSTISRTTNVAVTVNSTNSAHSHTLHRQQQGTGTGSANRYFASGSDEGGSTTTSGAHTHTTTITQPTFSASNGAVTTVKDVTTGTEGNMQPYIVVNRWHRTA